MAETHVIEIQNGAGDPSLVELRPGIELAPFGVGSEGSWRVQGNGILRVHAYIYFDGQALFVQSADDRNPALVDGHAIGRAWTPVSPPCTIALASATLVFRASGNSIADEDDQTVSAGAPPVSSDDDKTLALQAPVARVARPFTPGALAHRPHAGRDGSQRVGPDTDATRVVPLGATPSEGGRMVDTVPSAVRPAAGMRWGESNRPPPGARSARGARDAIEMQDNPGQGMGHYAPPPPPRGMVGAGQAPMGMHPGMMPGMGPGVGAGMSPAISPGMGAAMPAQPLGYAPGPSPFQQSFVPQAEGMMNVQPPGGSNRPPGLMNIPPPGLLNVPPPTNAPPKEEALGSRIAREWQETPPIKKLLLILMPLLLPAVWIMFNDDPEPPRRMPGQPMASASARATPPGPSSAAPFPTLPPPGTASASMPTMAPTASSSASAAPGPGSSSASAAPQRKGPPAAPADTSAPPDPSASGAPAPGDRRERQAADLVATGQFESAARVYDQLSSEHPENSAFREASRILRFKADAGIH